jgi:hypothetical protein
MTVTGGTSVKCTRVRMIIELADERVICWESRDPYRAEYEHECGRMPVDFFAGYLDAMPFQSAAGATLRIEGGLPYSIRIERDTGEIPPELADHPRREPAGGHPAVPAAHRGAVAMTS